MKRIEDGWTVEELENHGGWPWFEWEVTAPDGQISTFRIDRCIPPHVIAEDMQERVRALIEQYQGRTEPA
jgi:hypothetical protein